MYFAQWLAKPDAQPLGSIPTLVLTRAEGGYGNDQDVSAAQMEQERKDGQAKLKRLSSNSRQIILSCGHNMELEDPLAGVADAIYQKVEWMRRGMGKALARASLGEQLSGGVFRECGKRCKLRRTGWFWPARTLRLGLSY